MGKSDDCSAATEKEFVKLGQVLTQTADKMSNCLKLLKKQLSEYDSRNRGQFVSSASTYMRSDMRNAKDAAMTLTHLSHSITKNHKPLKTNIAFVWNAMDETAKAIELLKNAARTYDKVNGQRMGVKDRVDAAVGENNEKNRSWKHELFGKDKKHTVKDKQRGGHFGSKDESENNWFGKNQNKDTKGGFFGKSDKMKDQHKSMFQSEDDNGGGIMGSSGTVEALVTTILREHFSLTALDQQITATEKSL